MKPKVDINTNMIIWAIVRARHDLQEFISIFPKVKDWLDDKKT